MSVVEQTNGSVFEMNQRLAIEFENLLPDARAGRAATLIDNQLVAVLASVTPDIDFKPLLGDTLPARSRSSA